MPTGESCGESFVVTSESAESNQPAEGSLDDPSPWQQHETLCLGMFNDFQLDRMSLCLRRCRLTGIALIHKGQFHRLLGHFLNLFGKFSHLRPILFIRRCHQHGQQFAMRTHSRMSLGAFVAFSAIEACANSAFGSRLQRPGVQDNGRRILRSLSIQLNHQTQIMSNRLKDLRCDSSPSLLRSILRRQCQIRTTNSH